jgi:uncharacterized damage-inducible protein DinB
MIDIYPYYARCNTQITKTMLGIIGNNPVSFSYVSGGYYDSIAAILDHLYISNLNWIKAFSTVIETSFSSELASIPIPEYGSRVFKNIEEANAGISKTLSMTETLCKEIKESDLEKIMTRKRRNGEVMEKKTWKALIHYFNHQTHHRGQISEILDELKIENDYSNMIFIE